MIYYTLLQLSHAARPIYIISEDEVAEYDSILENLVGEETYSQGVDIWIQTDSGIISADDYFVPFVQPLKDEHPFISEEDSEEHSEELLDLGQPLLLSNKGVDLPAETQGILSGKAVYISQCHGWLYYDSLGRFSTQRDVHFSTVEDFHNPEGTNQYLIQYLENAGAKVFTVKERDLNPYMDIADNDGAGYSETGTGFTNGPIGFAERSSYNYGDNPFELGTTRVFSSTGGGVATWIPDVPKSGYYNVYVSWDSEPDNSSSAHYRIHHKGGIIDRYFDQRIHGSTWQYVERLWLEQGVDSLTVELIGDSGPPGTNVIADAVRIGGGMEDVHYNGQTTGRPRWESGAVYYTQFNGAPTSIYGTSSSDPASRSKWAAWEHPTTEDAVYLSWHSNACGVGDECSARGTSTHHYNNTTSTQTFAQYVQDAMIESFRENWDSNWNDRGVSVNNFAEVNPSYNAEMPAILVELAFHNNETDAGYLKEPLFRRDASRAMAHGIIEYFANKDGIGTVYPPEPPNNFRVIQSQNHSVLTWSPPEFGSVNGGAATSYIVYRSFDGRSWDNGTSTNSTSYNLSSCRDTQYFRVVAQNSAGVSFPTEVLPIQNSVQENKILIVSAFDRLQASSLYGHSTPVGSVKRFDIDKINGYDTAAIYGRSLEGLGIGFDSITDDHVPNMQLGNYDLIIWIVGEESTYDETFTHTEQQKITSFLNGGGKIIISGSEILWDLDNKGDASDKSFVNDVLHVSYGSDDADSYSVIGEGVLAGTNVSFEFGYGAPYHVEYPDVISSTETVVARYSTGGIAGILSSNVAFFGFPLESLTSENDLQNILYSLIYALLEPNQIPSVNTMQCEVQNGQQTGQPSAEPSTEPAFEPSAEPTTEPSIEQPSDEYDDDVPGFEKPKEEAPLGACQHSSTGQFQWLLLCLSFLLYRRK